MRRLLPPFLLSLAAAGPFVTGCDKLKKDGPSDDHLNRVHEGRRREREVALKQNGFWIGQLEFIATNDLDFSEINRFDERIKAITRESIRDAARKYLDRSRYVIGVLKPEKKKAA